MREVVLDTETTGLDPLETAMASSDRSPTGQTFRRYVCPERATLADALAVHGLSAEFLVDKPLFGDLADET